MNKLKSLVLLCLLGSAVFRAEAGGFRAFIAGATVGLAACLVYAHL